jgi:hypothetical protein
LDGEHSAFLAVLEVTDIRFDLSIYGDFFKDVLRRLGANKALDASVYALSTAFSSVHSHQQSTVTVDRYVMALKSLQVCLSDPAQAKSPNTLCAIYLVMICQVSSGTQHPTRIIVR